MRLARSETPEVRPRHPASVFLRISSYRFFSFMFSVWLTLFACLATYVSDLACMRIDPSASDAHHAEGHWDSVFRRTESPRKSLPLSGLQILAVVRRNCFGASLRKLHRRQFQLLCLTYGGTQIECLNGFDISN